MGDSREFERIGERGPERGSSTRLRPCSQKMVGMFDGISLGKDPKNPGRPLRCGKKYVEWEESEGSKRFSSLRDLKEGRRGIGMERKRRRGDKHRSQKEKLPRTGETESERKIEHKPKMVEMVCLSWGRRNTGKKN